MNKKLEKQLFLKYPKIFVDLDEKQYQQLKNLKFKAVKQISSLVNFGCECDDGWYWILDTLCDSIQKHIDSNTDVPQVKASQIKEKFAELRFYYSGGDKVTEKMIEHAENMSTIICEICGQKGRVCISIRNYWYKVLCEKCRTTNSRFNGYIVSESEKK